LARSHPAESSLTSLSVRQQTCNNSRRVEYIAMNLDISAFYQYRPGHLQFGYNPTQITHYTRKGPHEWLAASPSCHAKYQTTRTSWASLNCELCRDVLQCAPYGDQFHASSHTGIKIRPIAFVPRSHFSAIKRLATRRFGNGHEYHRLYRRKPPHLICRIDFRVHITTPEWTLSVSHDG